LKKLSVLEHIFSATLCFLDNSMDSDFVGLNNPSFDCAGQINYETPLPGYLNVKSMIHPRRNLFDGDETGCKSDISHMDNTCSDLYEEELDYLHDDYPASLKGEFYNIDELLMWERLMYQQRELNRMKLARQYKKLLQAEDHCTFMRQLIMKQQSLRQVLNEEENQLKSRWMSRQYDSRRGPGLQLLDQHEKKDSWGWKSSLDQFSEEESSPKSQMWSDSGKTAQPQELQQKSRHCRHFLKGHCERGESCGFRHDYSVFCTDLQKVFLGGLPSHLTASLLRKKLAEQGYTVLNNPKIIRWFSPQVCLGSVEEAQKLVENGNIVIDGSVIRVRPFEAFTRDNKKKLPDEVERSVFLGGLAADTTAEMIRDELGKMGLVVVNIPELKSGYSPQVALQTFEQARRLLKLMRVEINGSLVSVRPFANIRSSSGKKKNKQGDNQIMK